MHSMQKNTALSTLTKHNIILTTQNIHDDLLCNS